MEKITDRVESLSVSELKRKLQEHGLASGPITPTTKSRFQAQLAEKLAMAGRKEDEHESVNVERSNPHHSATVFFALSLPSNTELSTEDGDLVFSDKQLAFKALKKFKGARLKSFVTEDSAVSFSHLAVDALCASPLKQDGSAFYEGILSSGTGVSVESSPYHSVKTQDLCKLRKIVEQGDEKTFYDLVWSNPRYLISSGDTPTILQEGFRYNALHVAAKSNQMCLCQLVLDTLENPDFMYKLYSHSHETDETRTSRINFIVDLYLNTPDKGNCETPLHFASKFGHAGVVSVLVAHPMTVISMKNKHGETPQDVICSRCPCSTVKQKAEIQDHLEGQCYVPLIRSEDNVTQPMIGLPWSPDQAQNLLSSNLRSWTPKDPVKTMKAFAGPMSSSKAKEFHSKWALPSNVEQRRSYCMMRKDSEKGLERIGRDVAHEMGVPWLEYWPFLEAFADFSTPDGLDLLEAYLTKCNIALWLKENVNSAISEPNFNKSLLQNNDDVFLKEEEQILTNISFENGARQKKSSNNNKAILTNGQFSNELLDKSNSFSDEYEKRKPDESQIITSPMSSLSACFSGLTLLDTSLSDSLDVTVDEDGDLFYLCSDSEEDLSKDFEDLPVNISDLTCKTGGNEIAMKIFKNSILANEIKENQLIFNDEETNGYFTPPVSKEFPVLYFFMNFDHKNSELCDCISDFKTMKNDSGDFKFLAVLNLEECKDNEMSILSDIVFIPSMNSVVDYKIFREVTLELDSKSDLNKPSLLGKEGCFHAYIREREETGDVNTVVEAVATSNLSVISNIYIDGYSRPSKLDLNVYQAIEKTEIDCETYTQTSTWKKNVANLVADKNPSWPSPANIRSKEIVMRSAPQLSFSHLVGTPAALCQSPAQVRSHLRRAAANGPWSLDDLRIKLF